MRELKYSNIYAQKYSSAFILKTLFAMTSYYESFKSNNPKYIFW